MKAQSAAQVLDLDHIAPARRRLSTRSGLGYRRFMQASLLIFAGAALGGALRRFLDPADASPARSAP